MKGEPAFFPAGMLESSGRYRSQRASQLFARPPGVVLPQHAGERRGLLLSSVATFRADEKKG